MLAARLPVRELLQSIGNFQRAAQEVPHSDEFQRTTAALLELQRAIHDDFDVDNRSFKRRRSVAERKMQIIVAKRTAERDQAREQLAGAQGTKHHGRIEKAWFVRVGLADPLISVRKLK